MQFGCEVSKRTRNGTDKPYVEEMDDKSVGAPSSLAKLPNKIGR